MTPATLGKSRAAGCQLPYREWLALRRMARARGLTPAALVREIIREWMQRQEATT